MNSDQFTIIVSVFIVVSTTIWFFINHLVVFIDYIFSLDKNNENDSFLNFFKNYKKMYHQFHYVENINFKKDAIKFFKILAITAIFILIFLFFAYTVSEVVSLVSKLIF